MHTNANDDERVGRIAPEGAEIMALLAAPGGTRQTVHRAMQFAARLRAPLSSLFGQPLRDLLARAVPGEEDAARALHACDADCRWRGEAAVSLCAAAGIQRVTCADPAYPALLHTRLGQQAPPILFHQGNEALLGAGGAGIVGTRKPTGDGAGIAREAARFLADSAIPVISGGAAGVDLAAHEAAMHADGATVVVLAEGLHAHHPTPAIRSGLEQGQALLISEFMPGLEWKAHRAMMRNRTIAAMSGAVCVVEPRATGGSRATAEAALSMGVPVFHWGGAAREGIFRGRHGARPLATRGRLDTAALEAALRGNTGEAGFQADLFGE
ncbi:MAG: DNA-processing protein DprA [Candidatus Hydrogenedentes bacterium]|nr:DNA-processing protein DprA [Candidatus Hydrogenedentota bacterium]